MTALGVITNASFYLGVLGYQLGTKYDIVPGYSKTRFKAVFNGSTWNACSL